MMMPPPNAITTKACNSKQRSQKTTNNRSAQFAVVIFNTALQRHDHTHQLKASKTKVHTQPDPPSKPSSASPLHSLTK